MKFHPDVLAVHAEFGGDLSAMQALYDRPDHLARIAELEAENERLKQEVENWKTSAAGWQKLAKVDAEALASTGAVKVKGDSHNESSGVE